MVTEPQAPASPPKDSLTADPALSEAQPPQETPPADAPPEKPGDGEPVVEGDEAGAEPVADESPYKGLSDDEVWDHETLKPRREEADAAAEKRGRVAVQERVQGHVRRQSGQLESIDGKLQSFTDSWNDLVQGDAVEAADVKALMREHRDTFAAIKGQHQTLGAQSGVKNAVMTVIGDNPELTSDYQTRLDNVFQYGLDDDTFYSDLRASLAEAETKPLRDEIKELKFKNTRLEAEATAAGRVEGKPPAKPQGGGALTAGSYKTKAEARKLHTENKITSAQMKLINADPTIPEGM